MGMDDQGVVMNNMANIVPADKDSIAFSRTPAQVAPASCQSETHAHARVLR